MVVGGLKVCPVFLSVFYSGGKQMCDKVDRLKIDTPKKPNDVVFLLNH